MISFVVYGLPQPAGSKRAVSWHAKDGRSGTNVIDANPKAKSWKKDVAATAADLKRAMLDEPVVLIVTFYMARPKAHYGKKGLKLNAPTHPSVKPDLLKLTRGLEDALTGILWRDDSLIVIEHLEKVYGEAPVRTDITIWTLKEWESMSPHFEEMKP